MKWLRLSFGLVVLLGVAMFLSSRQYQVLSRVWNGDVFWTDSRAVLVVFREVLCRCQNRFQRFFDLGETVRIRQEIDFIDLVTGKKDTFGYPWSRSIVFASGDSLRCSFNARSGKRIWKWLDAGMVELDGDVPDWIRVSDVSGANFDGWSWRRMIFPYSRGMEDHKLSLQSGGEDFLFEVSDSADGTYRTLAVFSRDAEFPLLTIREIDQKRDISKSELVSLIDYSDPNVVIRVRDCGL